jgi:putative FmdB family regulatory protein
MPIYEYECRKCGPFEVTQRITENALRRCPKCKGKVSRLLSAPSIQFKGSGWYVTDYASKGSQSDRKKGESADSKSSDSTSDAKSDSKDSAPAKADTTKESSKKDSKASDKAA